MRYRRMSYRYTVRMGGAQGSPFGDPWLGDRLRTLLADRWRPDADSYETATTIEIVVDIAGIEEDALEIRLFENALVVEGRRSLPACQEGGVYHAAGIRQGPFQLAIPLPAAVDPERVEARYERGLLRITLAKRSQAD